MFTDLKKQCLFCCFLQLKLGKQNRELVSTLLPFANWVLPPTWEVLKGYASPFSVVGKTCISVFEIFNLEIRKKEKRNKISFYLFLSTMVAKDLDFILIGNKDSVVLSLAFGQGLLRQGVRCSILSETNPLLILAASYLIYTVSLPQSQLKTWMDDHPQYFFQFHLPLVSAF